MLNKRNLLKKLLKNLFGSWNLKTWKKELFNYLNKLLKVRFCTVYNTGENGTDSNNNKN